MDTRRIIIEVLEGNERSSVEADRVIFRTETVGTQTFADHEHIKYKYKYNKKPLSVYVPNDYPLVIKRDRRYIEVYNGDCIPSPISHRQNKNYEGVESVESWANANVQVKLGKSLFKQIPIWIILLVAGIAVVAIIGFMIFKNNSSSTTTDTTKDKAGTVTIQKSTPTTGVK